MSKVASDWRQAICHVDNLVFKLSNNTNDQHNWHYIFYCQLITNITSLNLESSGLTDSDIEILCESANNGNFRKLQDLMLGGNKNITVQSLHSIVNSEISKNLNYLFLDVTEQEIKCFVESHQDSLLALRFAALSFDLSGDSEGAMKYYKIAAESGDAISQLELSNLYSDNNMKDEISSKYWLEKSHQQGYKFATQQLAELFRKEGDYKKAFELYVQAAEKGLAYSMLQIAIMYENGQYVDQDYSKSKRWLFKSGNLNEIGKRYLKGICGFEPDLKRAIRCFENSPNSQYELGKMYLEGNEYIQKDAVKAVEILTGYYGSEAAELLGSIYFHGAEGVPKDIDKAIKCYYRTKDANLNLGIAFLEKAKTNSVYEYSARPRLTDAANEGSVEGQFRLAEFLRTKNEFNESDRNYTLAASQGHPLAQYQLGLYHKIGVRNFEKDLEKATWYFRESANQGCSNAQFQLALLLIPTNYEVL